MNTRNTQTLDRNISDIGMESPKGHHQSPHTLSKDARREIGKEPHSIYAPTEQPHVLESYKERVLEEIYEQILSR